MDVIKSAQIDVHRRNEMNPELGWWGLDSGGEAFYATMPDEMEYVNLNLFLRFAICIFPS